MRTILIPVDLSDATENVLKYAADFCVANGVERVILLKCYYVSVYAQLLPSPDFVQLSADDIAAEKAKLGAQLKVMGDHLLKKCNHCVEIETAFSELPVLRAVHELIAEKQPNVLMIGSDKTSYQDDSHLGEQIIAVTKTSTIPVMIIPDNVKYKKIELALVPCDFGAISRLSALQGFKERQKWIRPGLMVLNVNPKHKQTESNEQLATGLADMLEGFEYKVYYSEDKETVHGILDFAGRHDVQLIIALPGKYSFFYNLTHRSITNALALNATRPVLILK